jgi:uncharacterized membrane protein
LLSTVGGGIAGWGLAQVTVASTVSGARTFDLLMGVGVGVLGTATVVFSLLFLVVQWSQGHLTPRLTLFRDDPIVWRTFAYILGVFAFSVTAALSVGQREDVSVLIPVVAGALTLGAIWLIRNLQLKAFASVQLAPALADITARGRDTLRRLPTTGDGPLAALGPPTATITWPGPSCVLQAVRLDRLTQIARTSGGLVVLGQPVGATLLPGAPLADLHGDDIDRAAVLNAIVTGEERVFGEDPLLAFRILADIALRALSSAVNDPASAVQVIEKLHELLIEAGNHATGTARITDADGDPRVIVELPTWDQYLSVAIDDIIVMRGSTPMVRQRIQSLLDDLDRRADRARQGPIRARMSALQS